MGCSLLPLFREIRIRRGEVPAWDERRMFSHPNTAGTLERLPCRGREQIPLIVRTLALYSTEE